MKLLRIATLLIAVFIAISFGHAEERNHDVGDKECYLCHKFIKKNTGYLQSSHGQIFTSAPDNGQKAKGCESFNLPESVCFTPRSSQKARGCEACHGQGAIHSEVAGRDEYQGPMLIESFDPASDDVSDGNEICLSCHQGGSNLHWRDSLHEINGLACSSCHIIHSKQTKVDSRVCESCHTEIRAKLQRSSHKPMRDGVISCMECHNAHGSSGDSALNRPSVNETCFECHAELRGPFIWEHSPVSESCSNCHDPHGSNQSAMLKMRAPYLCQSCHQIIFHPSDLFEGSLLTPGNIDKQMVGKSCVNCHSKIHGSSHPSGAVFQR